MDTYTSGECDITIRTSIGERTTTKLTISKITQ
jgi:hypothetical protein